MADSQSTCMADTQSTCVVVWMCMNCCTRCTRYSTLPAGGLVELVVAPILLFRNALLSRLCISRVLSKPVPLRVTRQLSRAPWNGETTGIPASESWDGDRNWPVSPDNSVGKSWYFRFPSAWAALRWSKQMRYVYHFVMTWRQQFYRRKGRNKTNKQLVWIACTAFALWISNAHQSRDN